MALVALLGGLVGCSSGDSGEESGGGGGGNPSNGLGGATLRPGPRGQSFAKPLHFVVRNDHDAVRVATIRSSVPFPEGKVRSLANVGVSGHHASWLPLQHWPDGSIRVAQVQFVDVVQPRALQSYEVVRNVSELSGPFQENTWIDAHGDDLQFGARVRDDFGVRYEALVSGPGETLQESYLVRVRRWRLYHDAIDPGGIGRDYLTSTFYVTELREEPWLVVDWVLGNDYLGADDTTGKSGPNWFPLGAIDVGRAEFLVRGADEVRAYMDTEHGVAAPRNRAGGWEAFEVMRDTWIDDGQTRRFRFLLRVEDPRAAPSLKAAWKDQFAGAVENPVRAMPTLDTWQSTEGLGLHGGPIDGPADAFNRAEGEYGSWRGRAGFGTWGDFGEVKFTNTTGTPRNAPVSPELAWAAQSGNHNLLIALEQKAWAQAQRPYHMFGLQVDASDDVYLWDAIPSFPGSRNLSPESFGRRAIWANDPWAKYRSRVQWSRSAHGWNAYDHEHWTTDLLFDYWTISGDAWAREELRQLGESLKGLMRLSRFPTSNIQAARAEGWCMTGFVHVYLATGDDSIKSYALRRIDEIIDVQRANWHASKTLVMQGSHPLTGYPNPHKFFMPWQHGPVLYGFLAAHRFFGSSTALDIAKDVVPMIDYSWVTNVNDPTFGFVANGLRYYVPTEYQGQPIPADYWDNTPGIGIKWGDSPLGGAHTFLVSGLFLLADRMSDPALIQRAVFYGSTIMGPLNAGARWTKWNLLVVEGLVPP